MKRRRMYVAVMALCGATASASVQRSVWRQSRRQERWNRDVDGFSERDLLQNVRMTRANSNHHACLCLGFLPAHNYDEC